MGGVIQMNKTQKVKAVSCADGLQAIMCMFSSNNGGAPTGAPGLACAGE